MAALARYALRARVASWRRQGRLPWHCNAIWWRVAPMSLQISAVTSTDFRNWLTVPPNSNRIRLTERFASPYGALCFHVFTGSDSPPGPSCLSLQVVSLLVSNQTSFMQIKRQSKIITCGVFMHKKQISNLMSFFHRVIKDKSKVKNHVTPICATSVSAMLTLLLLAVSYCACLTQPDMRSGYCAVSAWHQPAGPKNKIFGRDLR